MSGKELSDKGIHRIGDFGGGQVRGVVRHSKDTGRSRTSVRSGKAAMVPAGPPRLGHCRKARTWQILSNINSFPSGWSTC
ncbi:hypothetical protein NBRGN_060_00990 [Nocardia brasiliensis NBRC 14402]|nr:hypothetical protein NBRGN_060_00990 [Nocardia brasiliensis NBRC 14402]